MDQLDGPLSHHPDTSMLQTAIISAFWGSPPAKLHNSESSSELNLNAYFRYYNSQCQSALHDYGNHVSVKTHRNVVDIVALLQTQQTKDEIRQGFKMSGLADDTAKIEGSLNLAARLLLMIGVGELQYGFSGSKNALWESDTLAKFTRKHFAFGPVLNHDGVKLEKTFNARNLGRIGGIRIIWTDNLAEHLYISDEEMNISIFHHACFLEYQKSNTIFPDGFIDETLRTLALLFPQSNEETEIWFLKLPDARYLDQRVLRCGHLRADDRRLQNFTFWRDRIVMLKQLFDEARPSTVTQLWYDRRNALQWYTFWTAVMTMVFGFIQSVEGALQVYKSYHPTRSL